MTYSIVARHPATGELGVAVQSHWFSVGPIVPWAAPGIGAVATQANAEPAYGPRALELLTRGATARQALTQLLAEDELAASRQVAVVDAAGSVAAHTGDDCIALAGHATGDGVSCQANIMASSDVWLAMLDAYRDTSGSLTARLVAALCAAEAQGGDLRGRQSAAILIVPRSGEAWRVTCSLRVEDHPEPLDELKRLIRLDDAYGLAADGDEELAAGRPEKAAALFVRACELAPECDELRFWAGLGLVQIGDVQAGLAHVRSAIAQHDGWKELLQRLPEGLAPSAASVRAQLGSAPSR